jgi:hypothetical protein
MLRIAKFKRIYPYNFRVSLGKLIDSFLVWSRTTEGIDFWDKIRKKYAKEPILII